MEKNNKKALTPRKFKTLKSFFQLFSLSLLFFFVPSKGTDSEAARPTKKLKLPKRHSSFGSDTAYIPCGRCKQPVRKDLFPKHSKAHYRRLNEKNLSLRQIPAPDTRNENRPLGESLIRRSLMTGEGSTRQYLSDQDYIYVTYGMTAFLLKRPPMQVYRRQRTTSITA